MPRPTTTRKPALHKPTVRKKKALTKRKAIARKKTLTKRKTMARKKTLTKRKTMARKKTLTKRKAKAGTSTARQPRFPRLSKVEARLVTMSADHRITRATLKDIAASQKRAEARSDKVDARGDRLDARIEKTSANLDKANARGDKLDARVDELVKAAIETRKSVSRIGKTVSETRKAVSETRKAVSETRKAVSETRKAVSETRRTVSRIGKTLGDVENRWGEFVEALLVGDAHKVLNGYRGIKVGPIAPAFPVECDGKERELDGVCFGADMVVIIEAKSRLREGHIGKFIGNVLQRFTEMMPAFRGKKIYGAVGYLNADNKTIEFAQKKGLIVLRTVHKTKEIVGETSKYKIRDFHP